MKIFPSPHIVVDTDTPDFLQIPLCHLDENRIADKIIVEKEDNFLTDKKVEIKPYTKISNMANLFFDDKLDIVNPSFYFENGEYLYRPSSVTEFVPEHFSFRTLIQRQSTYKTDIEYNIDITVDDIDSWKNLIAIFGDAPVRGIGPHNVYVNSGECNDSSLKNGTIGKTDFYFIHTPDGIHYIGNTDPQQIDVMEFINGHTNVWLSIDECEYLFDIVETGNRTLQTIDKKIYDNVTISSKYRRRVVNSPKLPFDMNNSNNFTKHELFIDSPILVYEKENKGFLVVSNSRLFDDLQTNAHLIYETLMWIYLRSYKESSSFSSWITNDPVQSMGWISCKLNRKHKIINENEVARTAYSIKEKDLSYVTKQVIMEKGDVFYSSRDRNMDMNFSKLNGSKIDPLKKNGEISILTTNGTVIFCQEQTLYSVESDVDIKTGLNGNLCSITISPFYSSSCRISVKRETTLTIPDNKKVYYLTAQEIDSEGKSVLRLEEKREWKGDTIKIATISVQTQATKACHDVRVYGGGLPKKIENDYDMMDIGNLYGRMYRKGNTLIIRLPDYLAPYDKYIKQSIEAWKNASTLVIIHYDNTEEM